MNIHVNVLNANIDDGWTQKSSQCSLSICRLPSLPSLLIWLCGSQHMAPAESSSTPLKPHVFLTGVWRGEEHGGVWHHDESLQHLRAGHQLPHGCPRRRAPAHRPHPAPHPPDDELLCRYGNTGCLSTAVHSSYAFVLISDYRWCISMATVGIHLMIFHPFWN